MQKREVVSFNGDAEVVRLKYLTGKLCSNGSYLYTLLDDDRALFATRELNHEIQAAGPRKGEPISILQRGKDTWDVRRIGETAPPAAAGQDSRSSAGGVTNGQHQTAPINGTTNTSGGGNAQQPAAPPTPKPAAPSLMTGQGQALLDQLISTYEAMVALEKYSELKGRPVAFSGDNFTSAAIGCCIQRSREQGGR